MKCDDMEGCPTSMAILFAYGWDAVIDVGLFASILAPNLGHCVAIFIDGMNGKALGLRCNDAEPSPRAGLPFLEC